ncbi:MAG: transglutaminase-like domain-containing protein [Polyangiaceae bacterium]|nr:transglutaminase-like domain-containing protein [Polyangiaceae bacterium]
MRTGIQSEFGLSGRVLLTLFSHVAARPDPQVDLAQAALLIGEEEMPGLDTGKYIRVLDELGRQAAGEIERAKSLSRESGSSFRPIDHLLRWMFEEAEFQGNTIDYYDPRNSFLSCVLDRRMGIPISLAVVLMEIGRRVGIEVQGVSFPGHFLARAEGTRGPIFINPFDGRILKREDLRNLNARAVGDKRDPDPRLLEPATKRQILVRMLSNLRGIYAARGDRERLRSVLERMDVLAPSEELREKLEELGGSSPWPSAGFTLN